MLSYQPLGILNLNLNLNEAGMLFVLVRVCVCNLKKAFTLQLLLVTPVLIPDCSLFLLLNDTRARSGSLLFLCNFEENSFW